MTEYQATLDRGGIAVEPAGSGASDPGTALHITKQLANECGFPWDSISIWRRKPNCAWEIIRRISSG